MKRRQGVQIKHDGTCPNLELCGLEPFLPAQMKAPKECGFKCFTLTTSFLFSPIPTDRHKPLGDASTTSNLPL
jgi:hypothetical protein